jgi:sphinganine C4-monooxygenase
MTGDEGRDIMIWASRLHGLGQAVPTLLALSGLNVKALVATLPRFVFVSTSFASGGAEHGVELLMAKIIYYGLMPALRLYMALWLADTWVFFIHRAEHSNKWLYSE